MDKYFADAVLEAFHRKKPILFIFTDFMVDDIVHMLKEIFSDQETVSLISQNFFVFGTEAGNTESNSLSLEFGIKEIPYFAVVMAKSETDYDVIQHYSEEEVELNKFKQFLTDSENTFRSLLEYLVQNNQYDTATNDRDSQNRGFVDAKHEEDRQIMQKQRQEFEQAQEQDRIKLEKLRKEEQQKKEKEIEERNYEQTVKDLAQQKKKDLPPEPEQGKMTCLMR
jgi:hypothetical protein